MKLYALNVGYKFGEITECEIEKETEKTYTIKINNWGGCRILKSTMSTHNYYICKTHEEAEATLKKVLNSRIERCKRNIEVQNNLIKNYTDMLVDLEKGGAQE